MHRAVVRRMHAYMGALMFLTGDVHWPRLICALRGAAVQDDEEELMRELDRIKKERAEDAAKKAAEEAAKSYKEKEKELMTGNPLLAIGQEANFAIKRRCGMTGYTWGRAAGLRLGGRDNGQDLPRRSKSCGYCVLVMH